MVPVKIYVSHRRRIGFLPLVALNPALISHRARILSLSHPSDDLKRTNVSWLFNIEHEGAQTPMVLRPRWEIMGS